MSNTILVTGATGFLGKVVLEELLRRKAELDIATVLVLIRRKGKQTAFSRFHDVIASSPCFSRLPEHWADHVRAVEGNVEEFHCGLDPYTYPSFAASVTHIIHCAASIKFDAPVAESLSSNVSGSLNVLALARDCPNLQRLVVTSTAYVSRHTAGPIGERLCPLPWAACDMLMDLDKGTLTKEEVLAATGLPNTYTVTKCLAEHLLVEQAALPLTIVRPSIISAAWQHPFPGWIDSRAALAGFVASVGEGVLKVLDGSPATRLDVVPVDAVASALLSAALAPAGPPRVRIVHAVATLARSVPIAALTAAVETHFAAHPQPGAAGPLRRARLAYVGPRGREFAARQALHHELPLLLAAAWFHGAKRDAAEARIRRTLRLLRQFNLTFAYFAHRTYDFRVQGEGEGTGAMAALEGFEVDEYLRVICGGVQEHLLSKKR